MVGTVGICSKYPDKCGEIAQAVLKNYLKQKFGTPPPLPPTVPDYHYQQPYLLYDPEHVEQVFQATLQANPDLQTLADYYKDGL